MKKQQIEIQNKKIRLTNQSMIQKADKAKKDRMSFLGFAGNGAYTKAEQAEDEPLRKKTKSKSPLTKKQRNNRDMPLKINVNELDHHELELKKKKQHDLGLEIFELKKEMGLYG